MYPPGIGKSCKFWGKVTNPDVQSVLPKIPSYLNMASLEVTEEYVKGFIQADNTFLYQLVYDPRKRELRPLTDYPAGVSKADNVSLKFKDILAESLHRYSVILDDTEVSSVSRIFALTRLSIEALVGLPILFYVTCNQHFLPLEEKGMQPMPTLCSE